MMVIISEWTGCWLSPQSTKYAFNKLMTQLKPPMFFHQKTTRPSNTYIPTSSPPKKKQHPKGVWCVNFPPIISQIVLSGVLHVIGKLSEAAPLFARALEGREAELGQHHPDTLATVNNFAVLLEATKRDPGKWRWKCFFVQEGWKWPNDLMTCHEGNMIFVVCVCVFFFFGE